jgi:hypothetical protein
LTKKINSTTALEFSLMDKMIGILSAVAAVSKDVHGVETLGDWVDFQEYIK